MKDNKTVEDFKNGARYTFPRKCEQLGDRICTIEVDDPGWDSTDFAHSAWFRGSEYGGKMVIRIIEEILNGERKPSSRFASPSLNALLAKLEKRLT